MGTKQNPSPHDCYAKALPDEPMFVLLGRDPMGEQLVLMWAAGAEMRATVSGDGTIALEDREKINEARRVAGEMADYCRKLGKVPMRWQPKGAVIERVAPKTTVSRKDVTDLMMRLGPDGAALLLDLARAAGVPE